MNFKECNVFLQLMTGSSSSSSDGLALNLDPLLAIVTKVKDKKILLHLAAERNQVEVVKSLICVKGIDVNDKNFDDFTALHLGSKYGHLEVVKLLVEKKANIDATEINGLTPLYLAICNKHFEVSDFLINNGANVNTTNGFDWTPLHFATFSGFPLKIVETLIAKGADVNAKEDTKRTALYLAAEHNHVKIINMLIANGVDIINYSGRTSLTPLHLAACKGFLDIGKCLLDNGADVNAKAIKNITPLHLAVENGHLEVIELLLAKGADVDAFMDKGALIKYRHRTPLHVAAVKHHAQITNVLLKYGANVNVTSYKGNTALNLAVQRRNHRNLEVVKKLLEYGANISISNYEGKTSLDNAVRYLADAKLLIKYTLLRNFNENYKQIIDLSSYRSCRNYTELSSYLDSCVCEIVQMKTDEIKESLSLYEFVTNKFNLHLPYYIHLSVRLATIDYSVRCPIYNDIILDKLKRFLERADLLDKLSKIQFYTYKLDIINPDVKGKKIILDHDSTNILTEYLTNDDLLNFIEAFDHSKKHTIDTSTNNDIKRARLE